MSLPQHFFGLITLALLLSSVACQHKQTNDEKPSNGAFAKPATSGEGPEMGRIHESGELIIATISGPDTYFDYQGKGMGLQYALAEDFAAAEGVAVRVELANDTLQLAKMLKDGQADLVAYPLSEAFCKEQGIRPAGVRHAQKHTSWAVEKEAENLAEALDEWYGEGVELKAQKAEKNRMQQRTVVHRKVRAPFISREKGIISTYDGLFKQAAHNTGWDWRLIAAQCYQESGFDPNAVSWAGAKGLMQIMPSTGAQFGLTNERIFSPKDNVSTAANIIRHLQSKFNYIPDAEERVKFVLAAYNGGLGHINDAQALARKYGGNPHHWADVSHYVRLLSTPRYYRDPVVKHGYMIGNETAGYVESIMNRWRQYGGTVRNLHPSPSRFSSAGNPGLSSSNQGAASSEPGSSSSETARPTPHKRNRFSKQQKILTPEELGR